MRLPWQTLALATAAVVASTGPAVRAALWLPTEGWGAQPWRVLTCHFVHHDPTHLLWDLGGFVVLGVALELRCVRSFTWAVGLGAVVVGVAMGILLPDEGVFGGLSGLDVALFAALAWRLVADGGADRRVGLLMGVALAAKLCWELAADGVLLDNIFDTARVGLMLLDADGGVVRINPTLTGHPALEGTDLEHVLDGASFLDLESRQPIPYGEMPFLRAARGESFDNSRFWIARPGHDMFAVTVSSRPLMVDGEFRGSIASVDDVTAYMRMLEDRDDFVALISHELRTPLTSIAGYIELAIDEEMSDQLRSWLRIVERNSTRLRTLVEDLLIVGEMSRGELHLEPAETDLRSLAQDAVATLAHRARNRGVELRLIDGPPVPLVADARRVSQVVENLISNGIKYTSDDGFVEVRVGAEGTDALLRVSDDGPGVAPDEAARVFERFYRSSAARASGVQGAGLGLWICRMIAQAHGGAIAFDSEVGAGSVATVRLPAGR